MSYYAKKQKDFLDRVKSLRGKESQPIMDRMKDQSETNKLKEAYVLQRVRERFGTAEERKKMNKKGLFSKGKRGSRRGMFARGKMQSKRKMFSKRKMVTKRRMFS